MAVKMIVEDGTGMSNSNSYCTVQYADDYWELRNDAAVWAKQSDEAKISALIQAAQYLDFYYRYIGDRYSGYQSMTWPRAVTGWDADFRNMEVDVIPQRIKDAQCELAREVIVNGPLLSSADRGGRVASETVGQIATTYFADAPGTREFPFVDMLLTDLLESSAGATRAALG